MPIVKISILDHWSDELINIINSEIHNALVESLKIPDWDYFHRIFRFSKKDFIFPSIKSDNFMIIEIDLFPGRSDEIKEVLYENIYSKLGKINIDPNDIFIQLFEQPLINWASNGKSKKQ